MQIIELDTQRVSLEFAPDEVEAVFARLRLVVDPTVDITRHVLATYDLLLVGDEELILMNDWDEPCLISQTVAGDALLRNLAAMAPRPAASQAKVRGSDKLRVA